MTRLTARDFPPALLELYDGYVHGRISRRQFLDRAGMLALGGMTAVGGSSLSMAGATGGASGGAGGMGNQ